MFRRRRFLLFSKHTCLVTLIFTKMTVSLSEMVRFSIGNHRLKALNEPYHVSKAFRAGALNGDNTVSLKKQNRFI